MEKLQSILRKNDEEPETDDWANGKIPSEQTIDHKLATEIDLVVRQQINKARRDVDDKTLNWKLLLAENELKLYRREENGIPCDPIKAYFTVSGVTGYELCSFFFNPKYRYDWDVLVDKMVVVEEIDSNTLIFMQKYKKVWFTCQRDSVFWSHMRCIEDETQTNPDQWIVVNHSTEHPDYDVGSSNCVRLKLTVCLACQTEIEQVDTVSRDNIRCKITYCANINPGGWTPPTLLRPFYKKEFPRFLKRLTTYAKSQTKDKPVCFG